ILVYDGVSTAEALGPYEVLRRVDGVEARFVARRPGPHTAHGAPGVLVADRSLTEVPDPDVAFVPGGFGTRRLMEDDDILWWLRGVRGSAPWIAAVSTGSMILGAAGVLEGVEATTRWLVLDELAEMGAVPRDDRIVEHEGVITAAGGSSAVEVAFRLAEQVGGRELAAQLRNTLALSGQVDLEPPASTPPTFLARKAAISAALMAEDELEPYAG
ncbi:MAG TPA: DJ-1/PfpI family protein, partial [Acidimicrobiales bacterium]|nr:DJ-1/PfpI family protein [Acidimicrobiales bacterium]